MMKNNHQFYNYLNNKIVILKERKKKEQISIIPIILHAVLFILIFFQPYLIGRLNIFQIIQIK